MNHFSLIYICSEYPSFIYIVLLLWRGGTYVGRQQHSGKMLTLNVNDEITFFAFLKDWKTVTEKFAILFFFFVFFFFVRILHSLLSRCTTWNCSRRAKLHTGDYPVYIFCLHSGVFKGSPYVFSVHLNEWLTLNGEERKTRPLAL